MDRLSPTALRHLAHRFKLLSNPTRLEILQQICDRELSVTELVENTGLKQANVSRQLSLMHRGELVRRRVADGRVYYSLGDEMLPQLCGLMQESLRTRQGEILASLSDQ